VLRDQGVDHVAGGDDAGDLLEAQHVLQVVDRAVVVAALHRDRDRPGGGVEGDRDDLVRVGGRGLERRDRALRDLEGVEVDVLEPELPSEGDVDVELGDLAERDEDLAELLPGMGRLLGHQGGLVVVAGDPPHLDEHATDRSLLELGHWEGCEDAGCWHAVSLRLPSVSTGTRGALPGSSEGRPDLARRDRRRGIRTQLAG